MIKRLWRVYGPKVVAWVFSKFITVLRLQPGDAVIVYDIELLDTLAEARIPLQFKVPLINGQSYNGREHLLFKQMNFKELTAIYQIALTAHQEAECERIQSSVSQG